MFSLLAEINILLLLLVINLGCVKLLSKQIRSYLLQQRVHFAAANS